MKRAEKPEQSCRRQEFVCRLYDVIKDLDKSLKSDCSQGANRFIREQANPFAPRQTKTAIDTKRMGEECACPPGCCEDSLQFKLHRIPNYPGMTRAQDQGGQGHGGQGHGGQGYGGQGQSGQGHGHGQTGQGLEASQYTWHKPYHSNGCWAGHDHGASGQGGGAPAPTSSRPQAQQSPQGFNIPSSPEEAMGMGCFVARAA